MTQLWSSRLSSRISALRNRPSCTLSIDASTFAIWLLNSSSARPYMSAERPYNFRLAYACGTASIASCTATSVGSRFAKMFQGTSARSYCCAEASAQPARSRAWFENGPSRRTRSSDCFARSKLPDSNRRAPSTKLDLSRIASPAGSPAASCPALSSCSIASFWRPARNKAIPRL